MITVVLGRKNNPDQPGIIFVLDGPVYQYISRPFKPMLLRSRYAVAEVGWFPQNNL
jgi:hypothetical protein